MQPVCGMASRPKLLMQAETHRNGRITSIDRLLKLCSEATVSMEVLFRRLHEAAAAWVECDHSFVLVGREENTAVVRGVCFGSWLPGQFPAPSLWEPEETWLRRAGDRLKTSSHGTQVFDRPIGRVLITKLEVTSKSHVYRLSLEKCGGAL